MKNKRNAHAHAGHRGPRGAEKPTPRDMGLQMGTPSTLGNSPQDRLIKAIWEHRERLKQVALDGRKEFAELKNDPGLLAVNFDEVEKQMTVFYLPSQLAPRFLQAIDDQTIAQGYTLFSTLAMIATWQIPVIGEIYTSEDKTYSAVTMIDVL